MDKQKGWPIDCKQCDLCRKDGSCIAENGEGVKPCEVMGRKLWNYEIKLAEDD